jgi:hypothetical protein
VPASEWFIQVDPELVEDRIDGHQIGPVQITTQT